MRINLQLEYANGTKKDVSCNAADIVAFEDKFDVSLVKIGNEPRIGWLLYLAWHAEKRTGGTTEDYEKWLESVESVGDSGVDPK